MQITIHRGLDQIGGCIIEISTATSRIFVDMGDNLVGSGMALTDEERKELVEGLFAQNKREHEAAFFTHSHPDHTGMIDLIPPSVPKYMSQGTKDILRIKQEVQKVRFELSKSDQEAVSEDEKKCIGKMQVIESCNAWVNDRCNNTLKTMIVGDIKITPLYVSHSTFDASMLVIEADDKRILHTGDYRNHGFLSNSLLQVLRYYAKDIDYIITEGTMLGRNDKCEKEYEIYKRMYYAMMAFKYVFVLTSSTDIERLHAVFDAAERAHRIVASCSLMHYKMLDYFNLLSVNNWKFNYKHYSPTKPNIELINKMRASGFAMIVGPSKDDRVKRIMEHFDPAQTLLIYSAWDGYYKIQEQIDATPAYKKLRDQFSNVVDIHTSGHADAKTIAEVITQVNPREGIIGIHKDANTSLTSLDISEELKSKLIPENKQTDCVTLK